RSVGGEIGRGMRGGVGIVEKEVGGEKSELCGWVGELGVWVWEVEEGDVHVMRWERVSDVVRKELEGVVEK
ncbi:hypothetical protein, partial [Micrococcus luteus]|uniref:hypothetical protein n=1 Tax=Micrococcus luteus TaxID=1270 RepID=UPI001C92EED4